MNNLSYQISNINFLLQSGLEENSLAERIDQSFGGIVEKMAKFLFFPIANIPVIVWVLMLGAIFFTIYHKFINFRGFKHSQAARVDCPPGPTGVPGRGKASCLRSRRWGLSPSYRGGSARVA